MFFPALDATRRQALRTFSAGLVGIGATLSGCADIIPQGLGLALTPSRKLSRRRHQPPTVWTSGQPSPWAACLRAAPTASAAAPTLTCWPLRIAL